MSPRSLALVVLACAVGAARPARGYTIGSPLTRGCHERITAEALRRVREATGLPPIIPPTGDEQALIDDLPYELPRELRDLGGAALTLAVRDNDIFGHDPGDEVALAQIAGNPDNQRQHCLRRPEQDEPGGSLAALADCAAFIRESAAAALDGLDGAGLPDANHRIELRVYLAIHGARTPAQLPLFHVRAGQALHALEDGFSHTFRTADDLRVIAVLNWVDYVNRDLDEPRDGPPHATRLDGCDEVGSDLRVARRERATLAATEALTALTQPGDRAARLAALDIVLAKYLGYQPGCRFDNRWCDAPENGLRDPGCPCTVGGARGRGAGEVRCAGWMLAVLAGLGRRRIKEAISRRTVVILVAVTPMIAAVILMGGEEASGDPRIVERPHDAGVAIESPRLDGGAPAIPPGGVITDGGALVLPPPLAREVVDTRDKKQPGSRFGVAFGVGGSVDRPALALFAGGRFRYTPRWLFGADVEWNPFLSIDRNELRAGALNLYLTAVLRFPLRFERVNLRTTGHAGISIGLLDVYGAPRGSVGPYVAFSPLGIDVDISRGFRFVLDPVELVLPVPHVTGLPFYYPQYRLSAGFQFGS